MHKNFFRKKNLKSKTFFQIYIEHTCNKFQRGIREVFLSFPGGFLKND